MYDFRYSFYAPVNRTAVTTQDGIYSCPSDRMGWWKADQYERCRGNYVVCWGNGSYLQDKETDPTLRAVYRKSAFGANRVTAISEIKDGTSKTMLMAEMAQAKRDEDLDFRGDFFNDDAGAAQFMTVNTPNSGVDTMACFGVLPNYPGPCLPGNPVIVSSRSKHPGGVHSLFADGSVHFLADDINLRVWQALGSIDGGEPIGRNEF